MEERRNETGFDLKEYLLRLKAESLRYEILDDGNGQVCTILDWPGVFAYGEGTTLEESINDLIECSREISEVILETLKEDTQRLDSVRTALKVSVSNDEELKRCLHGETCEDI